MELDDKLHKKEMKLQRKKRGNARNIIKFEPDVRKQQEKCRNSSKSLFAILEK